MSSIKNGNFIELDGLAGVRPVSEQVARTIIRNIQDYGVHLTELPEDSWGTSACQWMGDYWDVLVDLFSVEEGANDLALAVRVYEGSAGYLFQVSSVYVP